MQEITKNVHAFIIDKVLQVEKEGSITFTVSDSEILEAKEVIFEKFENRQYEVLTTLKAGLLVVTLSLTV